MTVDLVESEFLTSFYRLHEVGNLRGRVRQIVSVVDRMLVILPFEEEIYRRAGVCVEFVGHPLLELVHPSRSREQTLRPLVDKEPALADQALLWIAKAQAGSADPAKPETLRPALDTFR